MRSAQSGTHGARATSRGSTILNMHDARHAVGFVNMLPGQDRTGSDGQIMEMSQLCRWRWRDIFSASGAQLSRAELVWVACYSDAQNDGIRIRRNYSVQCQSCKKTTEKIDIIWETCIALIIIILITITIIIIINHIFNVAKIFHYEVHGSAVDIWIVQAQCLEMIGGTDMFLVCGRNRSRMRMTEYQEVSCSRG